MWPTTLGAPLEAGVQDSPAAAPAGGAPADGLVTALKATYDATKERFKLFKASPFGVFLLQRWLPMQDVASDALVTFCDAGFLLCSETGVWWGKDVWWARFSLLFMVLPYFVLYLLRAPIMISVLCKRGWPQCVACTAWVLFGLPATALVDPVMLICFPIRMPRVGWPLNVVHLRIVLEALLEAPCQTFLQVRIFIYEVTSRHADAVIPCTLMVSIATSSFSLALTLKDIKGLTKSQGIGFVEGFIDLCLVGLNRRAPLLHVLMTTPLVDYKDDGALSEEHVEQICKASAASGILRTLRFSSENFC